MTDTIQLTIPKKLTVKQLHVGQEVWVSLKGDQRDDAYGMLPLIPYKAIITAINSPWITLDCRYAKKKPLMVNGTWNLALSRESWIIRQIIVEAHWIEDEAYNSHTTENYAQRLDRVIRYSWLLDH
jgi:hypothetical protein